METFEQKYLKYKTKYLALKNTFLQNGGSTDFLEITNLSDTPVFTNEKILGENNNTQFGGNNDILEITNLSDTPTMIKDTQDGGKKKAKSKKTKQNKLSSEESSSDDSNLSTELSGGSDAISINESTTFITNDVKKYLGKNENDSTSTSDSSDLSLSNSSDSLLSALEDSLSDSNS